MNPWLAAGLAAAALWFLRMNSNAQQQAQNAQAGTQAGAGQTSDQGGGSAFTPNSTIIPYQGGVTQPVSTVSYQQSPDGGDGSGGSFTGGSAGSYGIGSSTGETYTGGSAGSYGIGSSGGYTGGSAGSYGIGTGQPTGHGVQI